MILHLQKTKIEHIDKNGNLYINLGELFSFQIEYINTVNIGEELDLWLYLIMKEIDNRMDIKFYAFDNPSTIDDFENFMSISGVGPRMAFNILKSIKLEDLKIILRNGEYEKIKKIPGIGDKLAKRIILELSRIYGKDDSILDKINSYAFSKDQNDVIVSLTQMGFDKASITESMKQIDPNLSKKDMIQQLLVNLSQYGR